MNILHHIHWSTHQLQVSQEVLTMLTTTSPSLLHDQRGSQNTAKEVEHKCEVYHFGVAQEVDTVISKREVYHLGVAQEVDTVISKCEVYQKQ